MNGLKNQNKLVKFSKFGILLGFALMLIGIVFKIMHWPLFYEIRIVALILISVFPLITFLIIKKKSFKLLTPVLVSFSWSLFTFLKISTLPFSFIFFYIFIISLVFWIFFELKPQIEIKVKNSVLVYALMLIVTALILQLVFLSKNLGAITWFQISVLLLYYILIYIPGRKNELKKNT
jgi:hypothetical protein